MPQTTQTAQTTDQIPLGIEMRVGTDISQHAGLITARDVLLKPEDATKAVNL